MSRLIDADALDTRVEQHYKHKIITRYDRDLLLHYLDVEMAPTVSPDMAQVLAYECGKAERKRGEWIKQIDEQAWWYECSVCGDYPLKDAYGHESLSQFCPWCGADMRGEANDRIY